MLGRMLESILEAYIEAYRAASIPSCAIRSIVESMLSVTAQIGMRIFRDNGG